jgi:hypothetical protein
MEKTQTGRQKDEGSEEVLRQMTLRKEGQYGLAEREENESSEEGSRRSESRRFQCG